MPVFDKDEQRVVVRIVYDGPAKAGKTTNLQRLCEHFTTRRRSELLSPGHSNGRTLFFDWLVVEGGFVCGMPLRCQLVTVPGQSPLYPRRKHLLRSADVVVFVCDSTPAGVEEGRRMLDKVRPLLQRGDHEVPIVVQANKQDLASALATPELLEALGLTAEVPVVSARAIEDHGVRETVVLAIRAAANTAQRMLLPGGVEGLETSVEGHEALHRALLDAGLDLMPTADEVAAPELVDAGWSTRPPAATVRASSSPPLASAPTAAWPSDLAPRPLEQPSPPRAPSAAPPAPTSASPTPSSPPPAPSAQATDDGGEAPTLEVSEAEDAGSEEELLEIEPDPSLPPPPRVPPRPEGLEPATSRPRFVLSSIPAPTPELPPLPIGASKLDAHWPDEPTVWGQLGPHRSEPAVLRSTPGGGATALGSGSNDLIVFEAWPWCLKTSPRRSYGSLAEAQSKLAQLSRSREALGELALPNTSFVVKRDEHSRYWLWTVAPWVTTLRERAAKCQDRGSERALTAMLVLFAEAALETIALAARRSIVLDLHPSNFGVESGRVRYIDDEVEHGTRHPALSHALLQRVEEYVGFPIAVHAYVAELERQLPTRFCRSELEAIDLIGSLRDARLRSAAAKWARDAILTAAERCPERRAERPAQDEQACESP